MIPERPHELSAAALAKLIHDLQIPERDGWLGIHHQLHPPKETSFLKGAATTAAGKHGRPVLSLDCWKVKEGRGHRRDLESCHQSEAGDRKNLSILHAEPNMELGLSR